MIINLCHLLIYEVKLYHGEQIMFNLGKHRISHKILLILASI